MFQKVLWGLTFRVANAGCIPKQDVHYDMYSIVSKKQQASYNCCKSLPFGSEGAGVRPCVTTLATVLKSFHLCSWLHSFKVRLSQAWVIQWGKTQKWSLSPWSGQVSSLLITLFPWHLFSPNHWPQGKHMSLKERNSEPFHSLTYLSIHSVI